jgi:hypothetical protein
MQLEIETFSISMREGDRLPGGSLKFVKAEDVEIRREGGVSS